MKCSNNVVIVNMFLEVD